MSFLESGKMPSKESFGISAGKRPDMLPKVKQRFVWNRQLTDTLQNFFAESPMMLVKAPVLISLAVSINAKPKYVAKNINFVASWQLNVQTK